MNHQFSKKTIPPLEESDSHQPFAVQASYCYSSYAKCSALRAWSLCCSSHQLDHRALIEKLRCRLHLWLPHISAPSNAFVRHSFPSTSPLPADLTIPHLIQPVWNDFCHQSLGPGESSHSSCDLLLPSLCPISLCFVWSLLHFCLPLTQPPSAVTQQVLPQSGYFFLQLLMLWQYLFIPNSQTHPINSPKSSFCHHFWSPVDHLVYPSCVLKGVELHPTLFPWSFVELKSIC